MKALVGTFNQEKALVGAFSVIVQPVVEPMKRFEALVETWFIVLQQRWNIPKIMKKICICNFIKFAGINNLPHQYLSER